MAARGVHFLTMPGCLPRLPLHLRGQLANMRRNPRIRSRDLDLLEQLLDTLREEQLNDVYDFWAFDFPGGFHGCTIATTRGTAVNCEKGGYGGFPSLAVAVDFLFY